MRLDLWLVQNRLAETERKAQGLVLTGDVLVNDTPVTSAAFQIGDGDVVRIRGQRRWVARSAEKLDYAIRIFNMDVAGKACLDAGASTGGFTQVLLERGARKVFAVDVAYGVLHPSIRNDNRVAVFDRTHICDVTEALLGERPDLLVSDLSFISMRKVLACVRRNFAKLEAIILFKPQFEVSESDLDKGIVRSEQTLLNALSDFRDFLATEGIGILGETTSPIKGRKGNQEYLFRIFW